MTEGFNIYPQDWRAPKIGLLGGSFNPAHAGHFQISLLALRRLQLQEVWWLVSPQNPLKLTEDMAPYNKRLASAKSQARDNRIKVSGVEIFLNTRYTIDTLKRLLIRFPRHRFVWIMGADNLMQITRWHRWNEIFGTVPIAVFDRPSYSFQALAGIASTRYEHYRLKGYSGNTLANHHPPKWMFLWGSNNRKSSTAIRKTEQWNM